MKSVARVVPVVLALGLGGLAHGQAAVVSDPTLNATTQAGFIEQSARLAQQIESMRQQLESMREQVAQAKAMVEQAKSQYTALTGSRNLGDILNNPAFRDYLPSAWQGVYDGVRSGGYSGLSGTARTIAVGNQVFDACAMLARDPDPARARQAVAACQGSAALAAQDKAAAMEAFERARSRLEQIEGLMRAINTTKDPKAVAELQARIAIEQAAIQNEQTKLQMFQLAAAADRELQAQREREVEARRWSSRKGITPPPVH